MQFYHVTVVTLFVRQSRYILRQNLRNSQNSGIYIFALAECREALFGIGKAGRCVLRHDIAVSGIEHHLVGGGGYGIDLCHHLSLFIYQRQGLSTGGF